MLTILSPAKTLDLETPPYDTRTQPEFLKEATELNKTLRKCSAKDLQSLMGLSEKLATLNVDRNKAWATPFSADNAFTAAFAFQGEVYVRLDAKSFTKADLTFAQDNLRFVSGLYGILRPLDLMQPYRLEMGTRLKTKSGKNLYEFWGSSLAEHLNETLSTHKSKVLINLASTEYSKAVPTRSLDAEVITPVFKEKKGDSYKVVAILAKRARGLMARYIVKKKLKSPEKLKDFDVDGYAYNATLSTDSDWVFTRD